MYVCVYLIYHLASNYRNVFKYRSISKYRNISKYGNIEITNPQTPSNFHLFQHGSTNAFVSIKSKDFKILFSLYVELLIIKEPEKFNFTGAAKEQWRPQALGNS